MEYPPLGFRIWVDSGTTEREIDTAEIKQCAAQTDDVAYLAGIFKGIEDWKRLARTDIRFRG
jgi:hypothetical protein